MVFVTSSALAQSHTHSYTLSSTNNRGHLGVSIEDITPKLKEKKHLSVDEGAYVTDVVEGSPAEKAGLQEGDVIVKFNGRTIEDSDDLMRGVEKTKPKTEVKIEVVRNKDHKILTATIGRVHTPRAYSFNFDDMDVPHMQKMPKVPKMPKLSRRLEVTFGKLQSGISVQELTKQLADYFQVPDRHGLLVTEVEKESEADKAGIKTGDVITKINKSAVRDIEDFRSEIDDAEGKEIPVEIIRAGKQVSVTLHVKEEEDYDDDYSLHVVPNHCPISDKTTGERSNGLRQDILDRVWEAILNLKAQIENHVVSTVERIRSTFA